MSDIEEIKSKLDIVDVVREYVPSLKRSGRSYKACCPFHQEKTPSFNVTPELQTFKCFGCGEWGDVLNFIQKIERVEFGEALQIAADKAGVELKGGYSKPDEKIALEKKRIIEANTLAAKLWNYLLKTHKVGKVSRDYVHKRGIRLEEIDLFMMGFAPKGASLVDFLIKKGFTKDELQRWGLAVERKGKIVDKFQGRLMMSIYDTKGNIIAFSGRIIKESQFAPKYLNSPETFVYKKSEVLMGLYQAITETREKKYLILEEGNIDLLSSHKVGVKNIAATGGTALTEKQCKLIKRYADTVYFAFDRDTAGEKALVRGLEIAERIRLAHKVIDLAPHLDPDELINKEPKKWQEVIANPINTIEYLMRIFAKDVDLGSADGKSTYTRRMMPILNSLKDNVQKEHFLEQLALSIGTTKEILRQNGDKLAKEPDNQYVSESMAKPEKTISSVSATEMYLLAMLLIPGIEVKIEIEDDLFSDINCRSIFEKINKQGDIQIAILKNELPDGGLDTLQEVLAISTEEIEDISEEIKKVYSRLKRDLLRTQILDLRKTLSGDPEDKEKLAKLQKLTKELNMLH